MKYLYIFLLLFPFLGFSQPDFQRLYQVGIGQYLRQASFTGV